MKKFFLFILFSFTFIYPQQNSYSGKFTPSLEGIAAFSHTDYSSSLTRYGVKLYGDYFLPFRSSSALGFRLSLSRFMIAGSDDFKIPGEYQTEMSTAGFGLIYMHSTNNIFFQSFNAGLSYLWFDPTLSTGKRTPNNALNKYERTSITYDVGVGLKYRITSAISINSSIELHYLPHDNVDDLSAGAHNDVYSTLNIGFSLLLGVSTDDDRDGIPESKDECPDAPEDFDGFQDADGCPDPDNDADGIPDIKDKCPDHPEDADGYEDYDGCPDIDNDKDGIVDDRDQCKDIAEDYDGYLDSDGCPDNDNDGDGIADDKDKCPNEAEDFDGYEDQDGCPDLDNDKDGIPDSQDLCPDTPEDKDGRRDDDGCPDKDNDNDGIPDLFDKCPNQKETYNGYLDDDGCPDTVPENLQKKREEKTPEPPRTETPKTVLPDEFTLDGVLTFYDDDYDIKPQAFAELDRIVELLKKEPNSRWRIEGHTDNVRPENENVKLSQQRATEILLHFVKKGLRYPRFEAVGLGSKYPVADNSKPHGRAKNRRVVIKRIK